jgi:pimeloyl-ACP methyl ester carboxylesterase
VLAADLRLDPRPSVLRRLGPTFLGAVVLLAGCGARARTARLALPRSGFVTANGVRLNYLDWGGAGTGMVFIHGLGDSPHAFDGIAPAFRNRFHVFAYARRAHGRSQVVGPYTHSVLAEDLRQLLDSLHIRKTVLVGWSLGGNELAEFTAAHPDRVAGLVFLECYDLSLPQSHRLLAHYPVASAPTPKDLRSQAAFRRWWKLVSSPNDSLTPAMEAEIRDLTDAAPGGRVRVVTDDSITMALYRDAMNYSPPYSRIRVPVLAMWGRSYRDGIIPKNAPDSLKRRVDAYLRDYGHPFQGAAIAHFRAAVPQATIIVLDSASHAIFPSQQRDTIIGAMRAFLGGLTTDSAR